MFTFWTKRRMHVKPVVPGSDLWGWTQIELTALESFLDDWRRAGLRIALHNLLWLIRRA